MNKRIPAALMAVVVVAVAGGCTSDAADSSASGQKPTKVTYVTSFGNFGRDAYVHVAVAKGLFAAQGIEVQIQAGTGTDGVQKVAVGRADFAAVDFSGATLQVTRNNLDVKAVALIQQRSLAAIMALQTSGIRTPKDLEGKAIADIAASVVRLLFPAYAKLAKVAASMVRWRTADPQSLFGMLQNPGVDAISQFVVGKGTAEAVAKARVVVLPWSDVMPDLPGNALWVGGKLLRQDPGLVARFRTALMQGLAYALEHPQEAGTILADVVPTANPVQAANELILMAPYVGWDRSRDLGFIDGQRIARALALLQGAGAIPQGWTPQRLTAYTIPTTATQQ